MMTKVFRTLFIAYSYFAVFMAGSVGAGDSRAERAMCVYAVGSTACCIAWLVSRKVSVRITLKTQTGGRE